MAQHITVGDRVECDDADFIFDRSHPFKREEIVFPKEGERYVVRGIVVTTYGIGLRFEELVNRKFYYAKDKKSLEPIFDATRFHKV